MLRSRYFFITGTDTDVGKTLIACGLLTAAALRGSRTMAIKPVAAGAELTENGLRNDDAMMLMAAMTEVLPYQQVNPVLFEPAIAPHIAAEQAGKRITVSQLAGMCRGAMMQPADFILIEGAGGWRVPLNRYELLSGLASALQAPVILVVGMKLGCINHALLTAEAIRGDGLRLAGWVGNQIDPDMTCVEENLATLNAMLDAPCIGIVPYLAQDERAADTVAGCLDISVL
jgi:dethiobiotin synthetase